MNLSTFFEIEFGSVEFNRILIGEVAFLIVFLISNRAVRADAIKFRLNFWRALTATLITSFFSTLFCLPLLIFTQPNLLVVKILSIWVANIVYVLFGRKTLLESDLKKDQEQKKEIEKAILLDRESRN